MKIRSKSLYLFVALAIAAGLAVLLPACAHLKQVLRTVDEIATEACELFGHDHPTEFATLISRVAPDRAGVDAGAPGFKLDPTVLCAIKSVVQPFLDAQLRLQQDTARSLQAGPEDSGGWRPAGADSSLP